MNILSDYQVMILNLVGAKPFMYSGASYTDNEFRTLASQNLKENFYFYHHKDGTYIAYDYSDIANYL